MQDINPAGIGLNDQFNDAQLLGRDGQSSAQNCTEDSGHTVQLHPNTAHSVQLGAEGHEETKSGLDSEHAASMALGADDEYVVSVYPSAEDSAANHEVDSEDAESESGTGAVPKDRPDDGGQELQV